MNLFRYFSIDHLLMIPPTYSIIDTTKYIRNETSTKYISKYFISICDRMYNKYVNQSYWDEFCRLRIHLKSKIFEVCTAYLLKFGFEIVQYSTRFWLVVKFRNGSTRLPSIMKNASNIFNTPEFIVRAFINVSKPQSSIIWK